PQKKLVALGPNVDWSGTSVLLLRHSSCDQLIGSVHCVFTFGPVGPLFGPLAFWPQCPSKPSQANGASAEDGGESGSSTTFGRSACDGVVVLSQPNPSCAPWPSQTDCLK